MPSFRASSQPAGSQLPSANHTGEPEEAPTESSPQGPESSPASALRRVVVMIHGLGSSTLLLAPLAGSLQRHGFDVIRWGYASILHSIPRHGDRLRATLQQLNSDPTIDQIQLVTHSMGGIVARRALLDEPIEKLNRVVMLCPPNGGSRVATNVSKAIGFLCQPLRQLSDSPDSYVNRLPRQMDYEVGVIAAAKDRVVAVEKTSLHGQADHLVVPSGHTSMLFRREVWGSVKDFLYSGTFASGAQQPEAA